MAAQILATDEGTFVARVAFRDPSTNSVKTAYGTKLLWEGGVEGADQFAGEVAAAVWDAVAWTVS